MIYSFEGKTPRIHPSAYLAPGCVIIGDVTIGEDVNIWPGVVLRGDVGGIRIGARSNIQDGTIVHVETGHDTVLEEDVTIGHQAMIHGCHIESGCLIGMSATVLSRARVGKGSIVGGGAVVLQDCELPPFSLAAGIPAKVKRELEPDTYEDRLKHAAYYVELGKRHCGGLVPMDREELGGVDPS